MKLEQGFTIIEVLVYLGLFTILVGGAVLASYNVIESNGRNQTLALMQQESNFLIGKINWALTGITDVNSPLNNSSGSQLSVTKSDPGVGAITITANAPLDISLARTGLGTQPLNSSNISVSDLLFDHQTSVNGSEWVKATFTLSSQTPGGQNISQNFSTIKYLRK